MGIRANVRETLQRSLGWSYLEMTWLDESSVAEANRERDELALRAAEGAEHSFHGNKLHQGPLSPGCELCGQGHWSCLFINRVCNAHCFYCLIDKRIKGDAPPNAGGLDFEDSGEYIDYLERFNYRAVGFSGGEPLLALPKVLHFIETIRARFGPSFYLWMYTNGILVNEERLIRLREAGLDEIRFDISAHDYDLEPVALAKRYIPRVTVEIPMIPEEYDRLLACLPEMERIGLDHLNVHQLSASEINYRGYLDRGYTFLHHPRFTVLESELAALRLLAHVQVHHPRLAVNYCTRTYKKQFQGAARRLRAIDAAGQAWNGRDGITANGFLRRFQINGAPGEILDAAASLQARGVESALWEVQPGERSIILTDSLLDAPEAVRLPVSVAYYEPLVHDRRSQLTSELTVALGTSREICILKAPSREFTDLSPEELAAVRGFARGEAGTVDERLVPPPDDEQDVIGYGHESETRLDDILRFERFEEGFPRLS